jgi:hypothetical protein
MSARRPVRAPTEWMNVLFLLLVACTRAGLQTQEER